jgi:hypothetical protein
MENRDQRQHRKILAILFLFYAGAHVLTVSFVWLITLALTAEGYHQLADAKTLGLVGASLFPVVLPLLSAYSLLRRRLWAKGVVRLTCLLILAIGMLVLFQLSRPRFSTNRVIFAILYGGASAALSLYGIWFAWGKEGVPAEINDRQSDPGII